MLFTRWLLAEIWVGPVIHFHLSTCQQKHFTACISLLPSTVLKSWVNISTLKCDLRARIGIVEKENEKILSNDLLSLFKPPCMYDHRSIMIHTQKNVMLPEFPINDREYFISGRIIYWKRQESLFAMLQRVTIVLQIQNNWFLCCSKAEHKIVNKKQKKRFQCPFSNETSN